MKKRFLLTGSSVILLLVIVLSALVIHNISVAAQSRPSSLIERQSQFALCFTNHAQDVHRRPACSTIARKGQTPQPTRTPSVVPTQSTQPAQPTASAQPTPTPQPTMAPAPTPLATQPPAPAQPTPAPQPTTPATTNPGNATGTAAEMQLTQQLLNLINSDRNAHGLPAYTLDATISQVSYKHSVTMATLNTLCHQCQGEPDPFQRMTNAGITYMTAGENVGYSSFSSDAWAAIQTNIHGGMMAEGPGGGHYENLMSSAFHKIGIGIRLSGNLVYVTEDFTN